MIFLQKLVSVELEYVLQKELIVARGNDFSHCLVLAIWSGILTVTKIKRLIIYVHYGFQNIE